MYTTLLKQFLEQLARAFPGCPASCPAPVFVFNLH